MLWVLHKTNCMRIVDMRQECRHGTRQKTDVILHGLAVSWSHEQSWNCDGTANGLPFAPKTWADASSTDEVSLWSRARARSTNDFSWPKVGGWHNEVSNEQQSSIQQSLSDIQLWKLSFWPQMPISCATTFLAFLSFVIALQHPPFPVPKLAAWSHAKVCGAGLMHRLCWCVSSGNMWCPLCDVSWSMSALLRSLRLKSACFPVFYYWLIRN